MKHIFAVFQNETDNCTYTDDTLICTFVKEEVADHISEHLQEEVGYVTRFGEQRTFSVKKVDVNQDQDLQNIEDILDEIHEEFDW